MKIKNYNQLSNEDKLNIINTFNDGYKVSEIPNILNISSRGVSRVLKEANIDTSKKNRYSLNENYFSKIDTEKKAYILGLLYADGYVGNEKFNNIVLSLKREDKDLIYEVANEIGFTGSIRYEEKSTNYGIAKRYILNFSSKTMANDLRNLGLYPGKSSTMEKLPIIPFHLIRHFIRGYFDGDGSVCQSSSSSTQTNKKGEIRKYKYNTIKIDIITTIKFGENLLTYLPKGFKIRKIDSKNMCYVTVCNKQVGLEFMKYIYNDCNIYMKRKFNKYIKIVGAFGRELPN